MLLPGTGNRCTHLAGVQGCRAWAYQPPAVGIPGSSRARASYLVAKFRPDVIITFGPEGAYGHADHRLVGDVVTQLVQAGVEGAPAALLYPGFPKERLPKPLDRDFAVPWSPVASRFLTVRVPYGDADLAATRAALACHKSQFRSEDVESETRWTHEALGGHVYLRPWFGAAKADDVFKLEIP